MCGFCILVLCMFVFSVMTASRDALQAAVSSSIVQISRKLFSFSNFVKITGSITFDVDGREVWMLFCPMKVQCVDDMLCLFKILHQINGKF